MVSVFRNWGSDTSNLMNTPEDEQKISGSHEKQLTMPSISLPKGGGAIRGIGEKFTANPMTGTGSLNVPIFTSTGRSGFDPKLSLSYDSGSGNSPFGSGWSLSLPSITRKTDKGLPKYRDSDESDEFILSGAEDLVPVLVKSGENWILMSHPDNDTFKIQRYRPRTEGLFARIERWTNKETGEIHWRSISRDNITTIYGKTLESRISDPADEKRVFSWLICESYDDKGNAIIYEYVPEDSSRIDISQAHENNRTDNSRSANRYLKRIKYGNLPSRLVQPDLSQMNWSFEIVFDYSDGHYEELPVDDRGQQFVRVIKDRTQKWPVRKDPFSSYRAGFEVRTYRLCRRVLMFHHFPDELGKYDYLVRSTEFAYDESPIASFITGVTQSGYVLKDDGKYLKKSLPPLEFEYSKATIEEKVQKIDAISLQNLPYGLDGSQYQWVDLDGEGISGVLTEQAGVFFYKPNLGGGKFGEIELVRSTPSTASLSSGGQQLMDLAGDGKLDLVELRGLVSGFYERTDDQQWETFIPFDYLPNVDWSNPNLKFLDLTGNGHVDVIVTEDDVFTWYPSLAEQGFGPAVQVRKSYDEEKGPRLVFADGTQSIYLADISGDGLTDLVRIRNGEVCYWPNLGYGHFGPKVTMDGSPRFDNPDLFDQRRIRLADIDGIGVTDIIYIGNDVIHIYLNQSGNNWSEAQKLIQLPHIDNLSSVMVADLLGNGTACLIWSSPLPTDAGQQMRFIDLMGGQKPHLLVMTKNNLGAETHIRYAPSTRFYLEDKEAGRPWITRLPFPVHVVERVEVYDRISQNRFVTRYAYHHGYFDGIEREFRGFGMVEQWDTEEIDDILHDETTSEVINLDEASYVPPVLTKTWFHTGAFLQGEKISRQMADEYYGAPKRGDPDYEEAFEAFETTLLPDTILPHALSAQEAYESCRALKGSMLRQEIYALDNSPKSKYPYKVSERSFTIKMLQPQGQNYHAVFFSHSRETIDYHYERNPADPRISHALTLEVDTYGNILRSITAGYPRAPVPERQPEQNETHLILTLNRFANHDDQADWHRVGLPVETRTYEIVKPPATVQRFTWKELHDLIEALVPPNEYEPPLEKTIPYEQWDWRTQWNSDTDPSGPANMQLRLIEHVRTLYRPDDLGIAGNDPLTLLPLGEVQSLALPGESYKLAFTPGLLTQVFQRQLENQPPENLLLDPMDVLGGGGIDRGGYLLSQDLKAAGVFLDTDPDDYWWVPSGLVFYSPKSTNTPAEELVHARKHFFLPHRYRDPFHTDEVSTEISVTYDAYDLLVQETRDALDNIVTAGKRDAAGNLTKSGNDYRVLQPKLVMDPNRNCIEIAFDALGMVIGTAVMGKPEDNPQPGDRLDSAFQTDLTQEEIDQFFIDPKGPMAASLLSNATTRIVYDLTCYWREPDPQNKPPAYTATFARETHASDPVPEGGLKIQVSFSYSDGFGREIQKKIQSEPVPAPRRNPATGLIITDINGQPEITAEDISPRWVGSGWTVFNNKGKPVRQYEPFFTDTHRFEFDVRIGVSPVLFYDPIERVVATLHPNHTWEKVVFDPWQQETWDVNDTVKVHPLADADISGYVSGYFEEVAPDPSDWKTWFEQRGVDPLSPPQDTPGLEPQKKAAVRTLVHAYTQTVAYFDTLGRTFLTVAHNRFKRSNIPAANPPVEEFYPTRILFDIEGNPREVIDAKLDLVTQQGRIVMRYDYDILGNRIHQESMEAGERWMLSDVTGKPIRIWNSLNRDLRATYDPLRRPIESYLNTGQGSELLVEHTVYGEIQPNPEAKNLRGKVYQIFDQAGVVTSEEYDYKGNLLRSRRQLAKDYRKTINWSDVIVLGDELEDENFTSCTTYDALNRPIQVIAPHSSRDGTKLNVIQPVYNEANLLERENVWLEQSIEPDGLLDPATATLQAVKDINYNAKGQRELIEYGNGVSTTYEYDPFTFRLTHIETLRGTEHLQDLYYTYDPAGNIIVIRDDAQQTIYFNGQVVKADTEYRYDSIYRLIEASGREHIGQASQPHTTWNDEFRVKLAHPNNGQAMRNYFEFYEYDEAGNILLLDHKANNGNWVRSYEYDEESQIESSRKSNRLSLTIVSPNGQQPISEVYTYDAHGSMTSMPHLPEMVSDFKDELQVLDKGGGCKAYYVYDAGGQRMRKVIEQNGKPLSERVYIGEYEIYRKYNDSTANPILERETLHIMDDKQRIALVETQIIDIQNIDRAPRQLIRYQLGNHLGSTSLVLDDQAKIISYEEYYPYGGTSYQAVRNQTEMPKRCRYTCKERDEESGLYYFGMRYYASWLGRWTIPDPKGLVDSTNLFGYVKNNPIKFIDLEGTNAEQKDILDTLGKYVQKGLGFGHKVEQAHFVPLKQIQRLYPQYSRRASEKLGELTLRIESEIHRKVDVQIRSYLKNITKIEGQSHLIRIVKDVRQKWIEAGFAEDIVNNLTKSALKTVRVAKGLGDAAAASEQRLPTTADLERSANMDLTPSISKGVAVELQTGGVISKETKVLKAGEELGERVLEKSGKAVHVLTKLGKAGRHFAAAIPIAGIVLGQASAAHAASQGDYTSAALDEAGFIPVAGDLLDAARGGVAIGEALDEGLGISDVATEHGERFEKAAKFVGLGEDASRIVGATGAALSSITVAPSIAMKRTVMGWFK